MSAEDALLQALDPGLPLPNGTSIVTRVSRSLADGKRVPEGAIGRVMATHEEGIDALIVGVGVLRYARSEISPRKLGEARFAVRREDAWDKLAPCAILESTVGSRAWGVANEGSDTDIRGVFALPFTWTTGLVEPPDTLVSADGSATYWDIGKAIRQAVRADPNTLEMLFVDSARPLDPIGEWLLEARDAFPSVAIYGSFGRYALAQLKGLSQSLRLVEHQKLLFTWLREEPAPSLDDVAARLVASAKATENKIDLLGAKEHIKQLYRSLTDRGLAAARDFSGLVAWAREHDAEEIEIARDYRPKNAYNLIRLLHVAIGWLETGKPELRMHGAVRDTLLAIKQGEISLADTLAEAERLTPALEAARAKSVLPKTADVVRADALLRRAREEAARRHIERVPGPFGLSAKAPPEPESP
jgi:hypothetical protein